MRRLVGILLVGLWVVGAALGQSAAVKTVHDEKGWKLTVDDVDLPVNGVVWSFTPVGENYTYDLFAQP